MKKYNLKQRLEIIERLKVKIKEENLSAAEVGRIIKLNDSGITKWLRGVALPSSKTIENHILPFLNQKKTIVDNDLLTDLKLISDIINRMITKHEGK